MQGKLNAHRAGAISGGGKEENSALSTTITTKTAAAAGLLQQQRVVRCLQADRANSYSEPDQHGLLTYASLTIATAKRGQEIYMERTCMTDVSSDETGGKEAKAAEERLPSSR